MGLKQIAVNKTVYVVMNEQESLTLLQMRSVELNSVLLKKLLKIEILGVGLVTVCLVPM